MRILEEIGIAFLDAETLALWQQAGAKVDHSAQHLWIDRQNFELWEEQGAADAAARAHKIGKQLLNDYQQPPMDVALHEGLWDYVQRRERELQGVNLYE